MKHVVQKDASGCGIACIAMVTEQSYLQVMKEARQLFDGWSNKTRGFYTCDEHLKKLLQKFKIETGNQVYETVWGSLPDLAIAAINHKTTNGTDYWHWVVFSRESNGIPYVLDPRLKTKKRTDFGRMKLHSYIAILSKKK